MTDEQARAAQAAAARHLAEKDLAALDEAAAALTGLAAELARLRALAEGLEPGNARTLLASFCGMGGDLLGIVGVERARLKALLAANPAVD